jgi:hypothetical protein
MASATTPSRRSRIIVNAAALIRSSGLVGGVTDEPPWDYLEHGQPWAWLFEGNEQRTDARGLHNRTERAMELHLHDAYRYTPGDSARDWHALGRERLARWQELFMAEANRTLGGEAWLIEEVSNAIGRPAATEEPIGILGMVWVVHYDTPPTNPRA